MSPQAVLNKELVYPQFHAPDTANLSGYFLLFWPRSQFQMFRKDFTKSRHSLVATRALATPRDSFGAISRRPWPGIRLAQDFEC
jgi:hypothetical protein